MSKRKKYIVLISTILLFSIIITTFLTNKEIMFSSDMKKGIEKYWGNKVIISAASSERVNYS